MCEKVEHYEEAVYVEYFLEATLQTGIEHILQKG